MIIRIVKMKFREECCTEFTELFSKYHSRISSFKNCGGVELLNDINNPQIFFTYSKWESEQDLENYRKSELFELVWGKTKVMFADKPEAWSLEKKS